jgi:hypothetical protein
MGISETIIAAIIGALATMATAIVQLIRNRAPSEGRPKKNRTRSVLATIALMIGCIVGGYAWSALRAVSAKEELTATMQAEFTRQFSEFATRQSQAALAASNAAVAARNGAGTAEALVHLPPCHISAQNADAGPVACNESVAQTVALCAAIPAAAQTRQVRLQSRVPRSESPWLERDAGAPTLGSLHIGASSSEYPVSPELRSVCLDVSNWSVEDTLAVRLSVEFGMSASPSAELTAAAPTAEL